jgi:hypothetical protein
MPQTIAALDFDSEERMTEGTLKTLIDLSWRERKDKDGNGILFGAAVVEHLATEIQILREELKGAAPPCHCVGLHRCREKT